MSKKIRSTDVQSWLDIKFFCIAIFFSCRPAPPNVKHIRKTHISNSNSVDTITKQLN